MLADGLKVFLRQTKSVFQQTKSVFQQTKSVFDASYLSYYQYVMSPTNRTKIYKYTSCVSHEKKLLGVGWSIWHRANKKTSNVYKSIICAHLKNTILLVINSMYAILLCFMLFYAGWYPSPGSSAGCRFGKENP